jgi:signal peptide peptidase SppA
MIIGFILLIILLVAFVGSLTSTPSSTPDIEKKYSLQIMANAQGERKQLAKTAPIILQVSIQGVIGMEDLSAENIRRLLMESREGDFAKDRVKGILLLINSPGGTVTDAAGIYHALKTYKERYQIPVYAYVNGLCASGGMYVACAADQIYTSDASAVGAIGVILPPFLNFSKLIEKMGVDALTLYAGTGKDEMNPLRPWKPGEQDNLQTLIDYFYKDFVNVVTTNRPEVNKELLIKEYGASIFSPPTALAHGLIDGTNYSLEKALEKLVLSAGITDNTYQVIELHHDNWYNTLFQSRSSLLGGKMTHQLQLFSDIPPECTNKFLYLYRP